MIPETTIQRLRPALTAAVVALQCYPLVDIDDPHEVLRQIYASAVREYGLLPAEERAIAHLVNGATAGYRFVEPRARLAPGEPARLETTTLLEIAQRARTRLGVP